MTTNLFPRNIYDGRSYLQAANGVNRFDVCKEHYCTNMRVSSDTPFCSNCAAFCEKHSYYYSRTRWCILCDMDNLE